MIRPPRLSACLPSSLLPLAEAAWPFGAQAGGEPVARTPVALPRPGDALLVVDVQRDFLPGGALPTPAGRRVLAVLNRCIDEFVARELPVVACRDWHPADHASFQARGGPLPAHCVAGSPGAEFAAGLRLPARVRVLSKGRRPDGQGGSAFEGTPLLSGLRARAVRRLFIGGLAIEDGIAHSALDALRAGLDVVVLRDAVAARDARPGDGERALARLRGAGARVEGSACWAAVP